MGAIGNGMLVHGKGFGTPNVEVVLPVASTTCLHILPAVARTLRPRQPSIGEINQAQAAFATRYCYAHKNDSRIDVILQSRFSRSKIGINAFSVGHRNYENTIFELFMSDGHNFIAPRR